MVRIRSIAVALVLLALPALATLTTDVPPADAATCHYVLGFKTFHHLIPSLVGACLSDEQHNPDNGDALQQTKKGLLVWRKADNRVVFTNGSITILAGPQGLEERPNSRRFPWEANPAGLPVAPDAPTSAAALRREFSGSTAAPRTTCAAPARSKTTVHKATVHRRPQKASKHTTSPARPSGRRATCA